MRQPRLLRSRRRIAVTVSPPVRPLGARAWSAARVCGSVGCKGGSTMPGATALTWTGSRPVPRPEGARRAPMRAVRVAQQRTPWALELWGRGAAGGHAHLRQPDLPGGFPGHGDRGEERRRVDGGPGAEPVRPSRRLEPWKHGHLRLEPLSRAPQPSSTSMNWLKRSMPSLDSSRPFSPIRDIHLPLSPRRDIWPLAVSMA